MGDDLQLLKRREWQNNGFGTRGKELKVFSNCFEMTRIPKITIQQYDVSWSDEQLKERRTIMNHLIKKERIFGGLGVAAVFDGRAIIYIPGDTPGPEIVHNFSEAEARGKPVRADRPSNKNQTVKITHSGTIDMLELAKYYQGHVVASANLLQALNALNVAIKYQAQLDHPSRKTTFYVRPKEQRDLGAGLVVWQGYFAAVRPAIGKLILNFDRAAGAFKKSGNALDVLCSLFRLRDPRDLDPSRMPSLKRTQMKRFLKNLNVAFQHSKNKDQTYKIRKVSDMGADQFMFEEGEGRQSNVARYIEQKYGVRLQFPSLPCVQLTKIAWYPLETISILPGSQFYGKLSPDQVTEMLKFTTMKPHVTMAYLKDGMPHLNLGGKSDLLRAWSLDAETRPMTPKARLLDPPQVVYAGRDGNPAPQVPKDGQWETRNCRPVKAGRNIARWFVLVFADEGGRDAFPLEAAQRAVTDLARACSMWGVEFTNKTPRITHVGNTHEVERALKDGARRSDYGKGNAPEFVVTILPNKSSPQYGQIKAACDVIFNVPSQNMLMSKLKTAKSQYFANLALKVNVKLGGINQRVGDAKGFLPGFDKTPTIVFGADVTHPGPRSLQPSIAGVVASYDKAGTQYSTQVRAQNSREEMIVDLEDIAYTLIKDYGMRTGAPPQRVLFYRDGVSESQFDAVCRQEIAAIKKACNRLRNGYNPNITYLICAKRHHIRMYPSRQEEGDRSGNCRAGTVIDSEIVHPFFSDFYLMSHGGLLGTSRPTHYTVLLDEAKLGPDQLQATTYYLAYIYARSTRSVSIASPAYYAHHVCERARHHVGDTDDASEAGSLSEEAMDAARQQALQLAIQVLSRGVGPAIKDSLYFM